MDKTKYYAKALLESAEGVSESEAFFRVKNFLALLKKRSELYLAPRILQSLSNALLQKRSETKVMSRFALDENTKGTVSNFLRLKFGADDAQNTRFETDESIIGGVLIRHKDMLFDGTIRKAVERMKAAV